jgi:hypothetical protein
VASGRDRSDAAIFIKRIYHRGEEMNVYEKMQNCRVALGAIKIKESGKNTFANYTYMELGDFLPHIVRLCNENKLCPVISFAEFATLTIYNSEKPEEFIIFSSPMSTASLKGCHEIQNLGATETYLRRYLYVTAFDISEHDALDSGQGKGTDVKDPKKVDPTPKVVCIGPGQKAAILDLISMVGTYTAADFCKDNRITTIDDLPVTQYRTAFNTLQAKAAQEVEA